MSDIAEKDLERILVPMVNCHVCGAKLVHDLDREIETCTNRDCQVYGVEFHILADWVEK